MNRWKMAFFVTILVLVASNGYWLMQVVDGAISYSYLSDSYIGETNRFKALGEFVVAGSTKYTQADFLHLLRQANKDSFIVEEDNKIFVEGVEFVFAENRLVDVK